MSVQPIRARASWDWTPLIIVIVVTLAYVNSFSGVFLFDDADAIERNQQVTSPKTLWDALCVPDHLPTSGRPIVGLSLAANYAVGKLDPWGYHAVNLAIHLLASLSLLGIIRRTLLRQRWSEGEAAGVATAAALLWGIHPIQTESVTYIVQRSESMAGLFYLFTFYCFVRAIDSARPNKWYVASVIACALGMGCKEVMVTAPVMLLLYDGVFVSSGFVAALRKRALFYLAVAATWGILAALVLRGPRSESAGFSVGISPAAYALTQCRVIVHYLRLVVWPSPLVLDYNWPLVNDWREALWPGALIGVIVVATVVLLWRRHWLGFLGAWALLILSPTSSVVPLLDVAFEHRMYLSLAAFAVAGTVGAWVVIRRWPPRVVIACVGAAIAASLCIGLTIRRNQDYQSDARMWGRTVDERPDSPRAHLQYGDALMRRESFDAAIAQYRTAIRLLPDYQLAFERIGVAYRKKGDIVGEAAFYADAVSLHPNYAEGWLRLGRLRVAMNDPVEAERAYKELLKLQPDLTVGHFELGRVYVRSGQTRLAADEFRMALRLQPDFAEARRALEAIDAKRSE